MPKKRTKLVVKPNTKSPHYKKGHVQEQQPQSQAKKPHQQKHHEKPTIPFSKTDRILLLGEGDLSFAASLVKHHNCTNVLATVYEKSEEEVLEKYPHAKENIDAITTAPAPASDDEDDLPSDFDPEDYPSDFEAPEKKQPWLNKILYNIDSTKPLPSVVARPAKPNRVFFNFPHVGGLSTDVNRQVRNNQHLLVETFKRVLPILAPDGKIIVTLFEGEPYTLWNIRDLGRHCGLQVERSFAFQAEAYPGYKHARTCGVIKNRKGEEGGGWKGEQRSARSYVFIKKVEDGNDTKSAPGKRKRRKDDDSDED
ncbi:uncharacterized protein F5Z01DRAFT_132886 [Emericellopsis atlantica]|uniref:25S rRNA (uridine-N(3))-methyltransferase BMT5-like domain-containing protein n=1 Tax=Emericellopsis atlantica TaxID=2614577 RepID=A0A9P8CP90_9HYPO|nr:uncharacterized protein F5Z01DRAFT_132886 [Emericellopsis atlantica]KAG9253875.1 hypothetical protein F5Z01DRAFT_132886 [Emericellopsis atlantica]